MAIGTSVWAATGFTTFFMVLVGVLGAMAYTVPPSSDLLNVINESPQANIVTRIAVYAFPFVAVTTSIPIFCIIVRYNLLENGVCGKRAAFFWSVLFPWLIVIPFYTGSGLLTLINWTSLVFSYAHLSSGRSSHYSGAINFVIPFLIYVKARQYKHSLDGAPPFKFTHFSRSYRSWDTSSP